MYLNYYYNFLFLCNTFILSKLLSLPYNNQNYNDYNSISIYFKEYIPIQGIIDIYEISYRSIYSSNWNILNPLNSYNINNISNSQIISIKVDSDKIIQHGTFTLGLIYNNLIPDDFQHAARTPPIPFDATSLQLKTALSALAGVKVHTVVRCDEFGNSTHSFGGFDGWFYHCPYASNGGYRWLVVFDINDISNQNYNNYFPKLYPFRENLGHTWSDVTEQVSVTHIKHGISPKICIKGICNVLIKNLDEGTPYVFQYRVHTSSFGWTEYSETSYPITTLAHRIPPKPRVPIPLSSTINSITYSILSFPRLMGVNKFESQYRITDTLTWINGPSLLIESNNNNNNNNNNERNIIDGSNIDLESQTYYLIVDNLLSNTNYEIRIRALNILGAGPYSTSSTSYKTQLNQLGRPITNIPIIIQSEISDTSIGVTVSANADSDGYLTTEKYILQYKLKENTRWLNHTDIISLTVRKEGVEVQEFNIRSDSTQGCDGYFLLELQGLIPNLLETAITTPISFNASEDEFKNAILSLPYISKNNPIVTVQRILNNYNGYIWTLNIEGIGNIPKFQLIRNELTNHEYPSLDCWTGPGPVVSSKTIQDGNDVLLNPTKNITITGLMEQKEYEIRLIRIDSNDFSFTYSNSTYATTTTTIDIEDNDSSSSSTSSTSNNNQYRDKSNPTLPGTYAEAAYWNRAARTKDFHYAIGSANGGNTGNKGQDGHCVIITYRNGIFQPYGTIHYYYTGQEIEYTVPEIKSQLFPITRLTIKCWGAGGAGGLKPYINYEDEMNYISPGGGGAFAQATLSVKSGDRLRLLIGGGGLPPQSELGGLGGYGGGGNGGNALRGGGGGGGGGSSIVTYLPINTNLSILLLVAAGGGGGGSTTYCCAGGGGGGVILGGKGTSSGDITPWPITDPNEGRPTPVRRRFEYSASNCTDNSEGIWCTSPWDIKERSLPADHLDVDYGEAPDANYSIWSEGGEGGSLTSGGLNGISGGYEVSSIPDNKLLSFDGGRSIVYGLNKKSSINPIAQPGLSLIGGRGAGGKKGGGGGGSGYYGGGGGGSGVDAAGGGGGSSYVNNDITINNNQSISITISTTIPELTYITNEIAQITWDGNWIDLSGQYPKEYAVELSKGNYSEDFQLITRSKVIMDYQNQASKRTFFCNIDSLESEQYYSVRILPLLSTGYGSPSEILKFKTLAPPQNYWEPVLTHRSAIAATGRGLYPVLSRPHLDVSVEIYGERTSNNTLRVSDPPTSKTPVLPSNRRGHSLSLVDEYVYMFGGRTDGYTCAFSYKDFANLGSPESGLIIEPCATSKNEVNELWSWNIYSYIWEFHHVVSSNNPPAREQHSAAVINGNIYIFGGKSRNSFPSTADTVYSDFWRLNIEQYLQFNHTYKPSSFSSSEIITEGTRHKYTLNLIENSIDPYNQVGSDGNVYSSRFGPCIKDIIIEVNLYHPCVNQLRISLQGPGPSTGSPNYHPHSFEYEVLLFDSTHALNTTACAKGNFNFIFDEESDLSTLSCCEQPTTYRFKPEGRIYEYLGITPFANWTLIIEDMNIDEQIGQLYSWNINYIVEPCNRQYSWTRLSPLNPLDQSPPARYLANMIVYKSSLYLFGGRGIGDTVLNDLYRYDLNNNYWVPLVPVNFDIPFGTASMVGKNLVLSKWGLIRFGGYIRLPSLSLGNDYVNDVYLMNPVTLKWERVDVESITNTSAPSPKGRYLSGSVFIPASSFKWRTLFSYRSLYDSRLVSTGANFAGALIDSLLIFGGHNGATGSFRDGSTGGMLNDMWQLRFGNWSSIINRQKQNEYVNRQCKWRTTKSGMDPTAKHNQCAPPNGGSYCDLRDLILLAWCNNENQTMA